MGFDYRTIIWKQFGAAIDMLGDALHACPNEVLHEQLWDNSPERPEFSQVWFVVSHALYWLDLYLSGGTEGFAPPARFSREGLDPEAPLPATPFTKEELQSYLAYCRRKCQATIETLTDEAAQRMCRLEWGEMSFAELQLYNMRHIQEHTAQLNLMLGKKLGAAPDWVPRARTETT